MSLFYVWSLSLDYILLITTGTLVLLITLFLNYFDRFAVTHLTINTFLLFVKTNCLKVMHIYTINNTNIRIRKLDNCISHLQTLKYCKIILYCLTNYLDTCVYINILALDLFKSATGVIRNASCIVRNALFRNFILRSFYF